MAGTLVITESLCWMPAGWIFDNALLGIAEYLEAGLSKRLTNSLTDVNGGYLDLQAASTREILEIALGLQQFIAKVVKTGPAGMSMPEFYAGYLQHLRQLADMLQSRQQRDDPNRAE